MPEIVCECGINHNGDFSRALDMVAAAYECGVDTVKFQYYDPEKLLDKKHPELKDCWEVIVNSQLTCRQIEELKEETESYGMRFLVSVFTPEDVRWLDSIGIERFKIASRSAYDLELAIAIAATGKPVLISDGYLNKRKTASIYTITDISGIELLYCVSKYPTPLTSLEFFTPVGGVARSKFLTTWTGFSDHTEGVSAAMVAMVLGASIIEKHFTLDKNLPGPDHQCSANYADLTLLCNYRTDINKILYKKG